MSYAERFAHANFRNFQNGQSSYIFPALVSFCDGETISLMSEICKGWRNNLYIQQAKEDAIVKKAGYSKDAIHLLRKYNISLFHLSKLQLEKVDRNFYIKQIDILYCKCVRQDLNQNLNLFKSAKKLSLFHLLNSAELSSSIVRITSKDYLGFAFCVENIHSKRKEILFFIQERDRWVIKIQPDGLLNYSLPQDTVFDSSEEQVLGKIEKILTSSSKRLAPPEPKRNRVEQLIFLYKQALPTINSSKFFLSCFITVVSSLLVGCPLEIAIARGLIVCVTAIITILVRPIFDMLLGKISLFIFDPKAAHYPLLSKYFEILLACSLYACFKQMPPSFTYVHHRFSFNILSLIDGIRASILCVGMSIYELLNKKDENIIIFM